LLQNAIKGVDRFAELRKAARKMGDKSETFQQFYNCFLSKRRLTHSKLETPGIHLLMRQLSDRIETFSSLSVRSLESTPTPPSSRGSVSPSPQRGNDYVFTPLVMKLSDNLQTNRF